MVIYFSATGNTEFIAKQLSERINDDSLNLINRIKQSYERIPAVAEKILKEEKLKAKHITLFEKIITLPFNPIWVKYKHTADLFYTTDKCVGCGKCVKLCPFNNIDIVDGRPVWGNSCEHCMACISNCPVEAIEYGEISLDQKRYRIGKYVKQEDGLKMAKNCLM